MKFTGTHKKWLFGEQKYEVDTAIEPVCVLHKKNNIAVKYLMRKALEQGSSVITFGSSTDYYKYVNDIAPSYIGVIDYKSLIDDGAIPYIKDSCKKAIEDISSCFADYSLENRFRYLRNRWKGITYDDPNLVKCFYQIKNGNIEKEKVVVESFMVNIISQSLHTEPLHEVVVFLDMPYKPITLTMFDSLHAIKSTTNMSIVSLYGGSDYDNQPVVVDSDGQKIIIVAQNKEYLITDG